MRFGLGALCLVATLGVSTSAFADDPQSDSVFLRNGTSAHGRVSEMTAYDHVTIVLPSGETRRFPWADVERVVVGAQAPFGPPVPLAQPPLQPDHGEVPYVHVHFTASGSGGSAFLYREPAGTMDWVTVCEAPCDADVPLRDRYRIGGNGNPTRDVSLGGTPGGSTTLHAVGRSTAGIVFGWLLIGTGSMLSIAAPGNDRHGRLDGERFVILTGAGAAALIAGIILYVKSASTEIEQHAATERREASVRRPIWRTLATSEQAAAPATFPVVFEGRF